MIIEVPKVTPYYGVYNYYRHPCIERENMSPRIWAWTILMHISKSQYIMKFYAL